MMSKTYFRYLCRRFIKYFLLTFSSDCHLPLFCTITSSRQYRQPNTWMRSAIFQRRSSVSGLLISKIRWRQFIMQTLTYGGGREQSISVDSSLTLKHFKNNFLNLLSSITLEHLSDISAIQKQFTATAALLDAASLRQIISTKHDQAPASSVFRSLQSP